MLEQWHARNVVLYAFSNGGCFVYENIGLLFEEGRYATIQLPHVFMPQLSTPKSISYLRSAISKLSVRVHCQYTLRKITYVVNRVLKRRTYPNQSLAILKTLCEEIRLSTLHADWRLDICLIASIFDEYKQVWSTERQDGGTHLRQLSFLS